MLQFDTWQIVVSFLTKGIHSWLPEVRSVKLLSVSV